MTSLVIPTLFFSVFITLSLIPLFRKAALHFHAVDIPDARKVHKSPVPRMGGAAMALGAFIPVFVFMQKNAFLTGFILGAAVIILFGLADDLLNLKYKYKFAGQALAALIVMIIGKVQIATLGNVLPSSFCLADYTSFMLTFLLIIGVTNAINLSDGLDGLAAGICLLAFCSIGYLAYKTGMTTILLMAVSMAGAIFGFLRFNTHPATIFMGDTGSQLLGFSGIVLSIKLTQESLSLSPILPLLLFGIPILDTLAVMMQRIIEGKSLFLPDKNHIHHKLMRLGLYHTEAVFSIYLAQSLLILLALIFRSSSDKLLLISYIVFSVVVLLAFSLMEIYGLRVKRFGFIESRVKAIFRDLRERGVLIRFCFFILKIGMPAVLILHVFIPDGISWGMASLACLLAILITVHLTAKGSASAFIVRPIIYLLTPFLIYKSEIQPALWMTQLFSEICDISFLVLAFFSIMTLKFTRRRKGFRFTTMDFLVLVVIFVVSILPDRQIQGSHLGMLAAKIIIIFFSFEILVGELRGKWTGLNLTALIICCGVALRGWGFL